jgi:glutamate synthase domain-containing protein 1
MLHFKMIWENYTKPAPMDRGIRMLGACGIAGFINFDGKLESGKKIRKMITVLKDRENGLGAGFAAYGLFPDLAEYYCLQMLFDSVEIKDATEEYLKTKGQIIKSEKVPTKSDVPVIKPPVVWRIFFIPNNSIPKDKQDDYIVEIVMHINADIDGAFCISSGKNMCVFKGNGWSAEVADFYQIENYKANIWVGHSRFPTNTPGWWGGAHPFSLLDWSVVHNGEITSYGTNKRFLEMYGYKCTLLTDTEVLAYLFDLLVRRHNIPLPIATIAFNPPLYDKIALMDKKLQLALKHIRITYRSAMVNGPFSIIVGRQLPKPMMIGLTDRKKLRPQVVALSDDENTMFISSEEAAIRSLALDTNFKVNYHKVWMPSAGRPVIGVMGQGIIKKGTEDPFQGYELTITEDE